MENEELERQQAAVDKKTAYNVLPVLFLIKLQESGTTFDLAKVIKIITTSINSNSKESELVLNISKECLIFLSKEVDDTSKGSLIDSTVDFCHYFYDKKKNISVERRLFSLISIIYLSKVIKIKHFKNLEIDIIPIVDFQLEQLESIQKNNDKNKELSENILPNVFNISEIIIDLITETGLNSLIKKVETFNFSTFNEN